MSKNTYRLASPEDAKAAVNAVMSAPWDGSLMMTIRKTETRREIQNRLYRCWVRDIANSIGQTEAAVHNQLRADCLAPIYLSGAENQKQQDWTDMYHIITEDHGETGDLTRYWLEQVISTTWATVSQFSRFLDAVSHWAVDHGAQISTHPGYEAAMGIKA